MRLASFVSAVGIFVASAALMYALAIAADLDRHSGVAVLILVIGVPFVMALQVADMIDERLVARRLRMPDRSRLPRARARYRGDDAT